MKKLGKSSKKGFTLVELIVVLVILAVLAAMLVPALVGYIDRAKKEKEFQAASTVYAAAQALATEDYGKGNTLGGTNSVFTIAELEKLTGVDIDSATYTVKGSSTEMDKYTIATFAVSFDGTNWYTYTAGASTWDTATAGTGTAMT